MRPEYASQSVSSSEKQKSESIDSETGKNVFQFLEKTGILNIRKNDEAFNEWIEELSYDDYKGYLTHLNGLLRELPTSKRTADGGNVEVSYGIHGVAYLPPYQEQKDKLMEDGFNGFKSLNNNSDRATLIYYIVQAIHPYFDGNGRIGRLLYEIINNNELNEETLSKLIDHNNEDVDGAENGREIFSKKLLPTDKAYYLINREVVKEFLGEEFLAKNGSILFPAPLGSGCVSNKTKIELSPAEIILAEKILGEGYVPTFSFRGIALAKLIEEDTSLQKYIYDNGAKVERDKHFAFKEDIGKEILSIDDEIMNDLNEKQVRRLIEIHKELKEKFIKTMIDIFVNENDHQVKNSNGENVPIKNIFRL